MPRNAYLQFHEVLRTFELGVPVVAQDLLTS